MIKLVSPITSAQYAGTYFNGEMTGHYAITQFTLLLREVVSPVQAGESSIVLSQQLLTCSSSLLACTKALSRTYIVVSFTVDDAYLVRTGADNTIRSSATMCKQGVVDTTCIW